MAKQKNANQELSVEERLRALYDLQLIDSRLDEIKNLSGQLPLEVEDLEDDITGLETRITKIKEDIKAQDLEVKQRKEVIKTAEQAIKKYQKQQDNVRNNREFDALTKEIEYQKLEIELANKRIKEYQNHQEKREKDLESAHVLLEQKKENLSYKKVELNDIMEDTVKEETLLKEKRSSFSRKIELRLLLAYDKIRAKVVNGLAVVSVARGASTGSFFTIPPQRMLEIAQRKKIITDEYSGRILVDVDLAEEEKQKMKEIISNLF